MTTTDAPERASWLGVRNHIDAGTKQGRKFSGRVGRVLSGARCAGFLAADDTVEILVQAGLFGREIGQTASRKPLRRYQTKDVVDLIRPPQPVMALAIVSLAGPVRII